MGDVVLERERKYELEDGEELPDFDHIQGVREVSQEERDTLHAVYFDSVDLRLARSGITLRRRKGGPDAGWHLKLPSGVDTRTEFHARLGDETGVPPSELADLVAGIIRGATLEPVARISTTRHRRRLLDQDGDVLAEVTDDRVSGQPAGPEAPPTEWREIEVELAERTDTDMLDRIEEFLVHSGLHRSASSSKLQRVLEVESDHPAPVGRGSTAAEMVLAYLREQVATVNAQDIAVRRGADDAVHQLRVASRRIRSALRVFGKIVDRERTRGLERDLRWLGGKLGPARDLEVLEERYRAAVAELPDELVLGEVNTRLTRYFTPARATADRAGLHTLNTTRYFRLREQLDQLLSTPPLTHHANRKARKEILRHVGRALGKVDRRMRTLTTLAPGTERDLATHSVRKAAKRLRYATEVAMPAVGRKAKRTRKRAKDFTTVLGEYQDGVVAQPPLRELGVTAHLAGDNGFTFGLLAGQERGRTHCLDRDLVQAWDRLSKSARGLTR